MSGTGSVAPLLALALIVAGCLGTGSPSLEEEAEQAIERFHQDLGPGGAVNATFARADYGGGPLDIDMRFGLDSAVFVAFESDLFLMMLHCIDGQVFVTYEGQTHEARYDEESCDPPGASRFPDGGDWRIVGVAEKEDGSLLAELLVAGEEGGEAWLNVTVQEARVVSFILEDDEGSIRFDVQYGRRGEITTPWVSGRLPASAEWTRGFNPGTFEGTVHLVEDEVALDEFEVQVRAHNETVLASFPMESPEEQHEDGFTFAYQDNGDDLFSEGDQFTIENPDWQRQGQYRVVVFDEWAGMTTDEDPFSSHY